MMSDQLHLSSQPTLPLEPIKTDRVSQRTLGPQRMNMQQYYTSMYTPRTYGSPKKGVIIKYNIVNETPFTGKV